MTDATIGFEHHDHGGCMRAAVDRVEARCARDGLQLTPVRRRVLEVLLEGHRAMGAYEVLDVLREEGLGSQPPVAYRALDFLVKHGFAHRIERLNAFVACVNAKAGHAPAFLICRLCKRVAEAEADQDVLARSARAAGFVIEAAMVEIEGLCPACCTDGVPA